MEQIERRKVLIEDTTLREGEQTPKVVFNEDQKRRILDALAEAKVPMAEVGIPVMGKSEIATLKSLLKDYPSPMLIGWNRGRLSDLQQSADTGFKAVHIGIPTSDIHIKEHVRKDHNWVLDTACQMVEFCRQNGINWISVSAIDMGRADIEFLKKYAQALEGAGATHLRLSDTIGCLRPDQVKSIIAAIREASAIELQLHMHNDFNLALANVLAGIEVGVSRVQVTVNGLGERAGLAALHHVVVALEVLYDIDTGIDMTKLPALSQTVSEVSGFPIAYNEPIVGSNVFSHESGIHVDGMLKDSKLFEPFPPRLVGREHELVLGKFSGSNSVKHFLQEAGIEVTRQEAAELLPIVREYAALQGRNFDPKILELFWKVYQGKKGVEA